VPTGNSTVQDAPPPTTKNVGQPAALGWKLTDPALLPACVSVNACIGGTIVAVTDRA
jgi:hypothetical protein